MTLHALHIGINRYANAAANLSKCVNDAKAMRKLFGGELLLDEQATRKNILAAITATVNKAQAGDEVVITYSGHGSQTKDGSGDEPDGFDETLVAADLYDVVDDELPPILAQLHVGARGLFVTDSCYSGTVHRAAPLLPSSALPAIKQRRIRYLPPALVKSRRRVTNAGPQASLPRWRHISGCTDFEYSYEGNRYGVLSGALFEGHQPGMNTGQWYQRACAIVQSGMYGQQQHPQLNASAAAKKWRVPTR